ncbi:unnamed protein product, partial [Mesorhabditis spiculigera]
MLLFFCPPFLLGLYPRSWTKYRIPEYGVSITIRQTSPVFPNNYQETSYPVTSFSFDVDNDSGVEYEISLAFVFRNGTGRRKVDPTANCHSELFQNDEIHGVSLHHTIQGMPCVYALAAKAKPSTVISRCRSFDPCGNGLFLWQSLAETGDLPDEADLPHPHHQAVGVCHRSVLPPNSSSPSLSQMSLAWDMPTVRFGNAARQYKRRYTRFLGSACEAYIELCSQAINNAEKWERTIDEWQSPVINHKTLPAWYKSALFNELYYMTDGGTLWFEYDDQWARQEPHLSAYTRQLMGEYGRFGYLESWEYRMITTYDVHFYASFAIASLWPQVELVIQAEFCDQVEHSIETETRFHMEGDRGPLKTRDRIPHDLGNPAADPWLSTNAYVMHDTGKWKDLNLKFVLLSWRDWIVLAEKEKEFLRHVYPAVKRIINDALEMWDQDGDGMIENFGKADQTYDAWQMEGVSAYCGSLWLGALRVAEEMAAEIEDEEMRIRYHETLAKAKEVFISKLWTGEYFRFCERSRSRESIMADQLCGIWFLMSCSPDMAAELIPPSKVRSSLSKIYSHNVVLFGGGRMGAVNGMRPDGSLDRSYIQADEMWTGVTYAVAAFMIQHGDVERGLATAFGCYDTCYERFGLQFQTPEAIYEKRFYRAIGYMRPLSIWSMQWAMERHLGMEHPNIMALKEEGDGAADVPSPSPSSKSVRDSSSEGYFSEEKDEKTAKIAKHASV